LEKRRLTRRILSIAHLNDLKIAPDRKRRAIEALLPHETALLALYLFKTTTKAHPKFFTVPFFS
jgi:hypothetical protein